MPGVNAGVDHEPDGAEKLIGEPAEVLVSLGYAGWTAGQLEWELSQNAWLTVEADLGIIFYVPPEERLAAAMQLLGVDFANLSEVAGHA